MIVWGGFNAGTALNSGGRYDPATDGWAQRTTFNAPKARNDHTATWTGHEMIIWGGASNYAYLDSGARYDPATDSWSVTTTVGAPTPRSRHTLQTAV